MGLEMLQMQNKLADGLRRECNTKNLEETKTRLFCGLFAMFLYLLIGAMVFVRIESPTEKYHIEAYEEFRSEWSNRLKRKGFREWEIDKLFSNIREAALSGIWREKNVSSDLNWTFGKAFFFSATLISTIGYGNISPKTPYGKLFTIIYCVIGIPLALSLISALSLRLRAQPSEWLRERINIKFGNEFHSKHLQLIHLTVLCLFILIFIFIIPSLFFLWIENDWTFIDAFFFCFVSLSTIGLGDYVPGDSPNQPLRSLYKILVTSYLIFGLCSMMLLLGTLYDLPQFNFVKFFIVKNELNENEGENETESKYFKTMSADLKYGQYNEQSPFNMPYNTNPFSMAPITLSNSNSYYQ